MKLDDDGGYACLNCDLRFATLKELLDHVREEHVAP